jgi:hypothetical protein
MAVLDILKTGRIPYNYKVGSPSSGKPMPFDVKLSIDPDFKRTIIKCVTIGTIGLGIAVATGIVLSKRKK